jgi:hypothetical protein
MYAMNKRILIPRKDHEIYFIPLPEGIKRKNTSQFIADKLHELHPGFSSSSVFDMQKIVLNQHWVVSDNRNGTKHPYRIPCP